MSSAIDPRHEEERRALAIYGSDECDGSYGLADEAASEEKCDAAEEDAARDRLNRLVDERTVLDCAIAAVRTIVQNFDTEREEERKIREEEERRKREAEEEEERARREAEEEERRKRAEIDERTARGTRAKWGGLAAPGSVKNLFGSRVACVALGGTGALFVFENGEYGSTAGLPMGLHQRLGGRPGGDPPPDYVAMGSRGRYYVRFADGASAWDGPRRMGEELRTTDRRVATVAFGALFDSYFIVYADGWWNCGNIPRDLDEKIKAETIGPDLVAVSLGPNGEWMMKTRDNKMWWGGLLPTVSATVLEHKDTITGTWFGDNGSYLIRHR